MSLGPGSILYGAEGRSYRLATKIGRGAQGSVWSIDGDDVLVAKFYHAGLTDEEVSKLGAMCRLQTVAVTSIAAWPRGMLSTSRSGKPLGFLMPRIHGYEVIHQLYGIKSRLRAFPEAQFPFLLHAATNTARAFATIHAAGQIIGDVNHSNLMVSKAAQVALIDCDSFQIADGGTTFRCPVGVPEFTPPELLGSHFKDQSRTVQHDAFGLAVLIFYLLFLGRHPFMGVSDGTKDEVLGLDQAIGRFAFPYALDPRSPEVRLPAFLPRLRDCPRTIEDLFRRAFTRDAIKYGRPLPAQWVNALTAFTSDLRECPRNPSHHAYAAEKECPWCRMEGVLGRSIFGISLTIKTSERFDLTGVWADIEAIRPTPEMLARPDIRWMMSRLTPYPSIHSIIYRRRMLRLCSVGVVVASSLGGVAALPPFAALIVIVVALVTARILWVQAGTGAAAFVETHKRLLEDYKRAEAAFDHGMEPPRAFETAKAELQTARVDYRDLGAQKAKRMAQLQAVRETSQRQHFLERHRIEDATIQGIGPKNKLVLRTWGVEDAWDIEASTVDAIKGFGPVKQEVLLSWRRSIEARFRFDPSQPVDPRDIDAIEKEFEQKSQTLQNALRSGPHLLRQTIGVWQTQHRQTAAILHQVATDFAQAAVNRSALRAF